MRTEDMVELITSTKTQFALDAMMQVYLAALGELKTAKGETYYETALRLDDPVLHAAEAQWWKLDTSA